MTRWHRWTVLVGGMGLLAYVGCDDGTGSVTPPGTGGAGGMGGEMTSTGGDLTVGVSQGGSAGMGGTECDVPCEVDEICSQGVCVPLLPCTDDSDCENDTYCDPQLGCLPWGDADPKHDENCVQIIPPGILAPSVMCELSEAPVGDPFPNHVDVQGTPVVTSFDPVNGAPPSIAVSFTATVPANYTEDLGVIRVLSGQDCSLQANLGGVDLDNDNIVDWLVSSASLAAGDLDGDGAPELVAYGADGSTIAFTLKNGVWSMLWKAPMPVDAPWDVCTAADHRCPLGWAGVSIHDVDDDGTPEVFREGVVFSSTGALLSMHPAEYTSYASGLFPVLANMDADANIEMTNGDAVWQWQGGWSLEAYYPNDASTNPSRVAVANFGDYGTSGVPTDPEIVTVRDGLVAIRATTGETVLGPVALPGGGNGGDPTIADFDGDGLAEVGVAGATAYTMYDIDCGVNPRAGGVCPMGSCDTEAGGVCPAEIGWSRRTQDGSSNVTGSSVFDFEADGSAEVVYGDECFVRVYDGTNGDVLFSQYRSSCTWYENPIIADVDGDFRAELVTPSNKACSPGGDGISCVSSLNADGVDPQFNGLRCDGNTDCVSGVCDQGLCRCTTGAECCGLADDAQCLEVGYACVPPEVGTPGTGNTCRAARPHGLSGIRVYRDANDLWVKSRPIWNQHAYAVTHVNEDGTIPSTSNWLNNWDDPLLNNFRQNVPGDPNGDALGDTTAGPSDVFSCLGSSVTLRSAICNRGATAVPAGINVGFYDGATLACSAMTTTVLAPEECEQVSCVWDAAPTSEPGRDVRVVADDGDGTTECKEGNNVGWVYDVFCIPPS